MFFLKKKVVIKIFVSSLLVLTVFFACKNQLIDVANQEDLLQAQIVMDFLRYECKSMLRYGSNSHHDPLYRIDGKIA